MNRRDRALLAIDGIVNLVLGVLLLAAPSWVVGVLGVPTFASRFYPSILGGVLVGIGVALLFEVRRPHAAPAGLGLAGAILINLCGGGVLAVWLVVASAALSTRGRITLWAVAAVVLGIAAAEIAIGGLSARRSEEDS